ASSSTTSPRSPKSSERSTRYDTGPVEMPKFAYTTLDPDGKATSGVVDAVSSNAAAMVLGKRDIQPLSLVEKKSLLKFEITKKKVKRKELMHFSRQLAVFVKAGVPILEA